MSAAHRQGETDERSADQEQGTRLGHGSRGQRFAFGVSGLRARNRTQCECRSDSGRWLQLGEAWTEKEANNETVGDEVHGTASDGAERG